LSLKGRSNQEIEAAVGCCGGLVTRIDVQNGESHVYFTGGEDHGKHLGAEPREVGEDEVKNLT
jgi:hypothetical protein